MAIHHSLIKKAAKFGAILEQFHDDPGLTRAFWPERAAHVYAASPAEAIKQIEFVQRILKDGEYRLKMDESDHTLMFVFNADGDGLRGGPHTPQEAWGILQNGPEWMPLFDEPEIATESTLPHNPDGTIADKIERINGIAIDGAVAYKEGTSAADCPYSSEDNEDNSEGEEYIDFVRWNEEWDAAADAHEEEEGKEGGSVVAQKYRLKYAEAGHPTHCGDWLANTLNEIVLNKEGVNLELFEAICNLNGVDTGKYKRSGVGWQGRIRMTGRNLLAKKVYLAGGVLLLPETINGGKAHAPGDWMQEQRFKMPKADQGAPTIAIASGAK